MASYTFGGGSPFGSIPTPTAVPNPAAALAGQIPTLPGLNKQASGVIGSELMGQLSPDTRRAIADAGAAFAVGNGMPGTNALTGTLANNRTAATIGQTSQQLQHQGLQDYNSFIPTVSKTQTVDPALQADVQFQNAVNAAAPNPAAAQSYAESLFNQYIKALNPPAKTPVNKTVGGWAGFQSLPASDPSGQIIYS